MNTTDPDVSALLAPLGEIDAATLAKLHERLETEARRDGLLDIAYRTIDTPVGRLLLARTEQGLVRIAFEREDHDRVLDLLSTKISPRILHAPGRLDPVAREVEEYLTGTRRTFDLPLDFQLSKGFRRLVLAHLREIGYGSTESYAQVADAAGSPRAFRAVGTACATNPLPIVVPCHRVVKSDGSFGGYAGGPEVKKFLLTLEAA